MTKESPRFEPKKEKAPEKTPEQETEAKYHFKEIAELEKPMANLVEQLKEAIDKGEYDTLISDDAGGRIPTLIMREIMSARMRKAHPEFTPEQDREALKTYFVAGGNDNPYFDILRDLFIKVSNRIQKKTLLVTEYIAGGRSIQRLGDALEEAGIPYDMASAASFKSKDFYNALGSVFKRHNLYIGEEEPDKDPGLYRMRNKLGGIERLLHKDKLYPVIYEGDFLASIIEGTESDARREQRDRLNRARQDVDLMAKRILEKVWKE